MTLSHYILILLWIVYYSLHSLLADKVVKEFFRINFNLDRYYRLIYTILVSILLVLLLWYQYSLLSPILFDIPLLVVPAILLMILPGSMLMYISLKKYFFLLSGIRAIYEKAPAHEIKINGIHQWMRHPLYTGTIMVVWGFFFIFPFLHNLIAVILLTLYVIVGIRFEEKKLIVEFGIQYRNYMKSVPALFPSIFSTKKKSEIV
ncbi:MAG: isoprenylcysteine carboxylmethyltransferase family protein [Ginsengibacter sp.]